jgi:hypothetical protein
MWFYNTSGIGASYDVRLKKNTAFRPKSLEAVFVFNVGVKSVFL